MISDIAFLRAENEKKPTTPPPPLISGWVHGFRVLPTGTPFPGFWDNNKTPYGIEIADNMSPYSPVTVTSVLKGAQLGLTAWAENVIGYWMKAQPTEIIYATATDDLAENWSAKRLDPLIDSIGMRDLIHAQTDPSKAKSRRSGDKTTVKEFAGGTLNIVSSQSAASLRSDSKRILVVDEVDGAPEQLKTGEGNFLDVLDARTGAWGARAKKLEYSTPGVWESSLILQQFELGDQRVYKVPCPRCGVREMLFFKQLRHEMKDGVLHKVWYQCPHCDGKIQNYEKTWMMDPANGAEWVPTATAKKVGHRSYYISSLYSPVGMRTWYKLYELYLEAKSKRDGMRSFVPLYLGLPFKARGSRPKAENIIEQRGYYPDGKEVPYGVLYLTMGVDVQQGSGWNMQTNCANDPENPPRLELEIVGHGSDHRTWSLAYKVIPGPIGDPHAGAWEAMHKWAESGGLVMYRSDRCRFPVSLIFIDSGDGTHMDVVYNFTARWGNTYPSKGVNVLKKRKDEKGDEAGPMNFKRYRAAKNERSGDITFYEISTNYYKSWTYTNLKIQRRPSEPQAHGFCDFPGDRGEKYFMMLTAEEKRTDGSFHAGGRRNEALDCRVMALCAADVYLDAAVSAARAKAKADKSTISDLDLQKFNHAWVIEYLTQQTRRRLTT